MILKKNNLLSKNTIEAYACSCNTVCFGCTVSCNPSQCGCDTTFFENPYANLTSSETTDSTSDVSGDQNQGEWVRYWPNGDIK